MAHIWPYLDDMTYHDLWDMPCAYLADIYSVHRRRADLLAAWERAYVRGTQHLPTKQEVINDQSAQIKELTAKLAAQLAAGLDAIEGVKAELGAVARKAGARATKSKQRAWKVRKINRQEWRKMLKEMRDDLKCAAAEDVEAAHGAALLRVRDLKKAAHAAKRAAPDSEAAAEELSGKRLARAQEAEEEATELSFRVAELEKTLHEAAADALEKMSAIRALKTGGNGNRRARWW